MNEAIISKHPRTPAILLYLASVTVLLIISSILWYLHTQSKDQLQALYVQNSRLQQELDAAKREISNLSSGDSSQATRERLSGARRDQAPAPAHAEAETFFLQTPTVRKTADGLAVRLAFNPGSGIDLPEEITLVVRVPAGGASKIISLKPVSETGDIGVGSIVNAGGNLALLQGSTADLGGLILDLTVSEPGTATVRGSEGIIDFELDITPEACNVRKL